MKPLLAAIAVTYQRPDSLLSTLGRLSEQTVTPDLVVVVDNDPICSEGLEFALGKLDLRIEYLGAKSNLGPAGAIGIGVNRVKEVLGNEEIYLVLVDDDDPPVRNDSIERLLELMELMENRDSRTVGVGLIGGRIKGTLWPKPENLASSNGGEGVIAVDWINGGYLPIYKLVAFERTGGFKTELFFGFEELEFGLHLKELGFSLYVDSAIWQDHSRHYTKPAERAMRRTLTDRLAPSWKTYWVVRNLHWVLSHYGFKRSAWYLSMRTLLGRISLRNPRASLRSLMTIGQAIVDGSRHNLPTPPSIGRFRNDWPTQRA